jgi:hypothetical protein
LNLTHTIGVTQNFCNERNFEQVWRETRAGRKLMAAKWMNQLDVHHPELGVKARMLNERDNFVMKHDPVLVKRRDEAKKRYNNHLKQAAIKGNVQSSVTSDSSFEHNHMLQQHRDVTIENPSFVSLPSKTPDSRTETTSEDSDFMSGEFH